MRQEFWEAIGGILKERRNQLKKTGEEVIDVIVIDYE